MGSKKVKKKKSEVENKDIEELVVEAAESENNQENEEAESEEELEDEIDPYVAGYKESKLKRGLDIFGDLFVLNVVFVITCLPVITIGASLTALYSMMFRIQRRDEGRVTVEYFQAFKSNFKRSTGAWLVIMAVCAAIYGEYLYYINFDGAMANFYYYLSIIELIVLAVVLPFVFPLLAYFDNTVFNTFRNALLLSISNLGSWLKMFLGWFAPVAFCIIYPQILLNLWYLWLLLAFGLIAYGTSLTARKVFKRVETTQKQKSEKERGL